VVGDAGFRTPQEEGTVRKYAVIFMSLLSFVIRVYLSKDSDTPLGNAAPILTDYVEVAIVGLLREAKNHEIDEETFKKVSRKRGASDLLATVGQLPNRIFDLALAIVMADQDEIVEATDCPVVRFVIYSSLQHSGDVMPAKLISPRMAGLQYAFRMVIFRQSIVERVAYGTP
jgi:hypothetical protein